MAAIWAIAAAVTAVVGTTASAVASKKAAEETQETQEASAFEARQVATRRRVRERRIAEARIRQSAANTGVGGSSGEAGALSSIATQFASAGSATMFAQQQSNRLGDIQTDLVKGQALGSVIESAGQVMSATASYKQANPTTTDTTD